MTIIHNVHGSVFGNMMIKYMVAERLRERIENSRLSAYNLEQWGISYPDIAPRDRETTLTLAPPSREMEINFDRAEMLARTGLVDRFLMSGHLQRMENFPPLERCRELFRTPPGLRSPRYPGHVVCPVRGAEILKAIHPGYTLLPVAFYKDAIESIGLPPIFIGQIGNDPYSEALKQAFPEAKFIPSHGAMEDFETIRQAEAVIVSISTFVWLAAWLSHAETIVLPSFGLFNRDQFPEHDLLPVGDGRYRFYAFPIHHAVDVEKVEEAHAALHWRQAPHREMLRA